VGGGDGGEPALGHGSWSAIPEAVTPLLQRDSPYNFAHSQIQEEFGGIEPLIISRRGPETGAMRIPGNVKTFEKFQRFLERDPEWSSFRSST
jgi:hypothetical protein